jgi:hypothetical protein
MKNIRKTLFEEDVDVILDQQDTFLNTGELPSAKVIYQNETKKKDIVKLDSFPSNNLTEEKLRQKTSKFSQRNKETSFEINKMLDEEDNKTNMVNKVIEHSKKDFPKSKYESPKSTKLNENGFPEYKNKNLFRFSRKNIENKNPIINEKIQEKKIIKETIQEEDKIEEIIMDENIKLIDDNKLKQEIHSENMKKLKTMSIDDKNEAIEEIKKLNPNLLNFLKNRIKKTQIPETKKSQDSKKIINEIESLKEVSKNFDVLPEVEKEKFEWMKDIKKNNEKSNRKRYGFDGKQIAETEDFTVHSGLYHHGILYLNNNYRQ